MPRWVFLLTQIMCVNIGFMEGEIVTVTVKWIWNRVKVSRD